MATSGATSVGRGKNTTDGTRNRDRGKTPAQWFCYLVGPVLLLVGILGFLADGTFDTANSVDTDMGGNADGELQGDSFLGFEVNGWHNIVHILSGLLLLAAAPKRKTAKTVALVFGVLYAIVTLIGMIDGNDILGILPVNPADNILHLLLSAGAILAALASRGDDHDHDHVGTGTRARTTDTVGTTTERRVVTDEHADRDRVGTERLMPRDLNKVDDR
jgi:hypothetical protein